MLEWIDDITDFIFLHDAPQKADILFIPGNGHAEPSEYAAQLYHSGYAPLILPSGRFSVTTGEFDGQKSGARRYEGRFETEVLKRLFRWVNIEITILYETSFRNIGHIPGIDRMLP